MPDVRIRDLQFNHSVLIYGFIKNNLPKTVDYNYRYLTEKKTETIWNHVDICILTTNKMQNR